MSASSVWTATEKTVIGPASPLKFPVERAVTFSRATFPRATPLIEVKAPQASTLPSLCTATNR
jgi:hypothetical protein